MRALITTFLRRFRSSEEGSIAVESILVFPILCWAYLATFVYFDAFRVQSTTLKAAYTISDALSREADYVTPVYLDSLYRLQEMLTSSNHNTKMTVSIVTYRASDNKYLVRWSQSRGGGTTLTNGNIYKIVPSLPVMPDGEVVIVYQNWLAYEPAFSIGLNAFVFENLVVTRPRFTAQVCYNTVNVDGTAATATC